MSRRPIRYGNDPRAVVVRRLLRRYVVRRVVGRNVLRVARLARRVTMDTVRCSLCKSFDVEALPNKAWYICRACGWLTSHEYLVTYGND
jgi:ribosomal protein L37AE/L43A